MVCERYAPMNPEAASLPPSWIGASTIPTPGPARGRPLNLLAYVHLRNIHQSTGAGRVARQLTEHLALLPSVNLRVLADERDRQRILPLVGTPWQQFQYHTFASETSRQQARWYVLNRPAAESFWPEADVVFCTGESYIPVSRARLAVTAHDAAYFETDAHHHDLSFWRQQAKWRLLFHRLGARADMLHTVSHFSAERLAHFFPALASRIRVVPNAVTPGFFTAVPEAGVAKLRQLGLAERTFVLIPGGLHFRKNAELIVAAAPRLLAKFPDLVLAVVNHSDPVYAARVSQLGSRFQLLGFVSDEALHALYDAATAVWFPSRYEGFGLPVLEAMAAGAPVVASNASSLPEIAGSAALLADPQQPDAHIDRLAALLEDGQLRQHFAALGRARAAEFTWQRSAAQLKQCFDALL